MKLFKILLPTVALLTVTATPSLAISEGTLKYALWVYDTSSWWAEGDRYKQDKIKPAQTEVIKNCFTPSSNERDCRAAVKELGNAMR